jgi:hypothetical protein
MIVLAVSGIMFLIAASFINGKQARTAFNAGVNEMASNIQDVIEQVTDGKYSDIPLNCSFDGTNLTFPAGSNPQGTNASCVFLGKVLHFQEAGGTGPADERYETFSLAGGRTATNATGVVTPANADAQVISFLTDQQATPQSLDVSKITFLTSGFGSVTSYGLGFLQGQIDPTNNLLSNTPSVMLYYVTGLGVGMNQTTSQATAAINGGANLALAKSVDICMTDSTRYADIIIGNNLSSGSQLVASVKMDGTTRPATC